MINKKYLPSKQFTSRIIIFLIFIVIFFSLYKITNFIKTKTSKTSSSSVKLNIIEKVGNDDNNNGIPNWEEKLWGLNPRKNGPSNKEFILSKRNSINLGYSTDSTNNSFSKNENLSKEFFAAIVSLQQTGELDQNAMNVIADSISQKIISKPLPNIYKKSSLKIVPSTTKNNKTYLENFKKINEKYKDKDIGSELIFIMQALADKNPSILSLAQPTAEAYRDFGKDLMKISVPSNISSLHLIMANNYEKNAESIEGLMKLNDNALIGLKSLVNYKKYNDALVSNIEELSSIIKQ